MKNLLFSLFVGAVFIILVQANEKYDSKPDIQKQNAVQLKNRRYMIVIYIKKAQDGTYIIAEEKDPYAIRVNLKIKNLKPGTKSITVEIKD